MLHNYKMLQTDGDNQYSEIIRIVEKIYRYF